MAGRRIGARAMLERLVGFDTVSAKSNLALVAFAAEYLESHGARVKLVHDEARTKANLFATLGPANSAGGVALSGHTDVVPVAGQDWSTDPFALAERDARLYGRGAADMKGFIACALALAPDFASRPLRTPVHYALTYDEEVGCLGVRRMLGEIGRALPRPRLVLVGEPTGMRVVGAHKGIRVLTTTVTGREGHSSRPAAGVNAIAFAAEIVGFLGRLADALAAEAAPDDPFDPPGTTLNVGTIQGGTAVNIVARRCDIHWEFRPVPGADADGIVRRLAEFVATDILPRMRAVDPAASVVTRLEVASPPLARVADSPAERLACRLAGVTESHTASFMCEAGLYTEAGMPAVVCGPGHIAQAHKPDEYVEIAQIERCSAFLARLGDWAETAETAG